MLRHMICERFRKQFIDNCIAFDTPRLESETYPEDVKVEADILYDGKHALDYYIPAAAENDMLSSGQKAYLLIHGGAFVYGFKKLDQNFGMHLAIKAGIPVVNVDYTLMPDATLSEIIDEIFKAMNFVYIKYGFKKYHTVGDSAGGYLAYMVAVAARSRHVAHGMWVFEKLRGTVESAGLVCPGIKNSTKEFPGIYFENLQGTKDDMQRLPDYAYDLNLIAERDAGLRVAIITGEEDFLREQDREFSKHFDSAYFYDAVNDGELRMFHVFPIAHPEWPQSVKAIGLIAENAVGRR